MTEWSTGRASKEYDRAIGGRKVVPGRETVKIDPSLARECVSVNCGM